jgi:hypothetical protein
MCVICILTYVTPHLYNCSHIVDAGCCDISYIHLGSSGHLCVASELQKLCHSSVIIDANGGSMTCIDTNVVHSSPPLDSIALRLSGASQIDGNAVVKSKHLSVTTGAGNGFIKGFTALEYLTIAVRSPFQVPFGTGTTSVAMSSNFLVHLASEPDCLVSMSSCQRRDNIVLNGVPNPDDCVDNDNPFARQLLEIFEHIK